MTSLIGTLREKSLHAELKKWYAQPEDRLEESVDGFVIDIVQEDMLIEIQSRSFSNIKRKINTLCEDHKVRLIYPIAKEKWIVRLDSDDKEISRRKSPKKGRVEHMFKELRYIPEIPSLHNFSFEVILIHVEEFWRDDGMGSWRRKGWSIVDQELISVFKNIVFHTQRDYVALLPNSLGLQFTNRELSKALKVDRRIAQNMTYCLHKMGALDKVGKEGRAILYRRTT